MNKGKLIRLTRDSFVRNYNTHGYITNQLTNNDRIFNETGADFLLQITRECETLDKKVNNLLKIYNGVEYDEIFTDFVEFVQMLENEGFILSGDSVEEMLTKEPVFSYKDPDVRTAKNFFSDDYDSRDTTDFITEDLIHEHQLNSLTIELTKKCNEICVHCYLPEKVKKTGKYLSVDKAKKLLDEAGDMGLLHLTFTGGEPLLHPDFHEIIRYASKKDLMISLLSNLTLINDSHIQLFNEINLKNTQVSLYSLNEDTHDFITRLPGSFKKTMSSIKRFLENDIPVTISCPVINNNYRDYPEVIDWANDNKISAQTDLDLSAQTDYDTLNLKYITTSSQNKELIQNMLISDKDWQDTILNEYAKGVKTKDDLEIPPCSVGNNSLYISSEAFVYPCSSWQSYEIANLNEVSLKEAWDNNNPKIARLREIKRKHFPEFVNSPYREFMNLCMARNANNNQGEYMKMDSKSIEIAKITHDLVEQFVKENMTLDQ